MLGFGDFVSEVLGRGRREFPAAAVYRLGGRWYSGTLA